MLREPPENSLTDLPYDFKNVLFTFYHDNTRYFLLLNSYFNWPEKKTCVPLGSQWSHGHKRLWQKREKEILDEVS
jgi:hypothetical protein